MLESKKSSISNSIKTKEAFQEIPLEYCPECLSAISNAVPDVCSLCKNPITEGEHSAMLGKMLQEISFQIIESKRIKKRHEDELLNLKAKRVKQYEILKTNQSEVNNSMQDVKSLREEKIDALLFEKGQVDGQFLQLSTFLEQAEKYQSKLREVIEIETKIAQYDVVIAFYEDKQQKALKLTSEQIESFALNMLHSDLNREEGFKLASNLRIDYSSNSIYIDDRKKRFSASSNFYLKTVVRFAIFFASLELSEMRFPRFILCDNMEDNGIEPERAQNFQNLIIQTASKYKDEDYQLIYTTSFIPDELEGSEYCIGDFYSEEGDNKSLKFV